MEPVSIIASALVAGATAAVKDTASQAVKDAYNGLKSFIQRRFRGNQPAETALAEAEKDPETWERPLARAIADHAADEEVLALAKKLLELLQTQQAPSGKYVVNIQQGRGTVIGDKPQVTQYFDIQPTDGADKSE